MKIKHIGIFATVGSAVLIGQSALAQEEEQQRSRSSVLEEIVVTSERREQSLQDVPLSITAFGDEKRDTVGIMSIQDMADFAPGVSYNTSNDSPSIRGIARQSNIYTLDSPVANYVDGVYSGTVQDAGRRPIFVERTEILRGPQGALAGRGSIAGAVNTILKRPEDQFGVEVRSFAGNYASYGVEATVTGPITDWLRGRVNVGKYNQDEGYFENVATGRDEGNQLNNREIVDIMFEADIGENVEWYVKAAWVDYVESRHSSVSLAPFNAGVQNSPTPWGPTTGELTPIAGWGYFDPNAERVGNSPQNPAIFDVWEFSHDWYQTQELTDDYNNYTSDLVWHAPSFDVRYILGNQDYTYDQWMDADGTDVRLMTLPPFGREVFPGGVNQYTEDRHWSSHEITLASTTDGPFQWVFGLFRSDEDTRQEPFTITYPGYQELAAPAMSLDAFLSLLGAPHNPAGIRFGVPENAPGQSIFGQILAETTSQAVFGQVEYQFNDEWKFTLGLRYNEDEKEATESARFVANNLGGDLGPLLAGGVFGFLTTGAPAPIAIDVTPVPTGGPLPNGVVRDYGIDPVTGRRVRDLENTWTATTGSVGVDWTPNADTLVFGRVARGYRPGGFNAGFINSIPQVDEETVTSFEIGYKGTIAEQLQLSTAIFYYDFEDSQQELPTLGRCTDPDDLSSCAILNSFINIPESESMGLEVELNWAITDNLAAYLTYGYLDATIKDGIPEGTLGFTNPDDPAAVLPGADRLNQIPGQIDTGYTFLPRWTQDITGNKLANSPEHRVALNLNYSWDFNAGSLTLSGNYIWRDDAFQDLFENELAVIPGYDTVGLRALWRDIEDRYTVIVYGANLTDEEAPYSAGLVRQATGLASAANPSAAGQAHYQTLSLAAPRTYGIEFQYRFGN